MPATPGFISSMPKVELHVHLEGSIQPETLLRLADRHGIALPATDLEGLRDWYRFRDFPHFVEVYVAITKCVKTPDDLAEVVGEFVANQAAQNIVYTEATYTASTVETHCGIPFSDQWSAIEEARRTACERHGVGLNFILDIVRGDDPARAMQVLDWVTEKLGNGVCALGLAGFEDRGTSQYAEVFTEAMRRGVPVSAHAGETQGAWSIQEALDVTGANRIGHGVRCLEDPQLVDRLLEEGTVLEVCPTSNVALGVLRKTPGSPVGAPIQSIGDHPVNELIGRGLRVTVNSDDPPLFSTTLTEEFTRCCDAFSWEEGTLAELTRAAAQAAFLPHEEKAALQSRLAAGISVRAVE